VIVRRRFVPEMGLLVWLLASTGCSDSFLAGPIVYEEQETMTKALEKKSNLADKPVIREKVRKALSDTFGESPQKIVVPPGAPLTGGEIGRLGIRLANHTLDENKQARPIMVPDEGGGVHQQAGGYALYRRHCVHCHGVSGAGDGPTAPFLYPYPRDYRRGLFKFTSTPNGARPDRDDLRRTVRHGLHGTSMPAFEALLTDEEIEEVLDYVIFLTNRGESELSLIEEGFIAEDSDPDAISGEIVQELVEGVFKKWNMAHSTVVNPPVPRTPTSQASVLRGRELFLGKTKEKLECAGCHGVLARGDGPSFVSQDVFNFVVFGGNPSERQARLDSLDEKTRELWGQKLDEWGNPLRPANLNRGVYKGGRRPIDIYWRIAKGITGAQMPAHYPTINHEQIWDLVNFVLALPYQPHLLRAGEPSEAEAEAAVAVNR
jgi:mono/diheme cytochrome c family protein